MSSQPMSISVQSGQVWQWLARFNGSGVLLVRLSWDYVLRNPKDENDETKLLLVFTTFQAWFFDFLQQISGI